MGIQIMVDSGADIMPEEATKLGVQVIPLRVAFGEEEYYDGASIDHDTFFEKLIETDELPKTSQVSPGEYLDAFEACNEDEIICITISSKLSGCYQSATIAASDTGKKVFVVDSLSAAIGERLIVETAVRLRDKGCSVAEIANTLAQKRKEVKVIALLDTLEYLKKGGRISAAAAAAGSVLSIKPVLSIVDGEITVIGKARGSKMGNNRLIEFVKLSGGIDFSQPFCLAYSGLSRAVLDKYIEDSRSLYEMEPDKLPVSSIGAAIGTHVGPGVVALAFFGGSI